MFSKQHWWWFAPDNVNLSFTPQISLGSSDLTELRQLEEGYGVVDNLGIMCDFSVLHTPQHFTGPVCQSIEPVKGSVSVNCVTRELFNT